MLGAGKHDVNNVNNVQCLITVSIGEALRPGEETLVAASIPTPDTQPTQDLLNKFSIRGQLQFRIPT